MSLLVVSGATLTIPHLPTIIHSFPSANHSLSTTLSANATKTHTLGDWPHLPFDVAVGNNLILSIDLYGRKANVPQFSTIILDSLESIIFNLDRAGRPMDLIGPLEMVSYNGLVLVRFGANVAEEKRLTRLDASEILSNVWDLVAKYGPREIVLAAIEHKRDEEELMGLFVMKFPGPVMNVTDSK
ncbi:MAG: hypothetical protein HETSPECPRED_007252 [Heterodermia speciosa]|uniref:Uncharacterized protein n=1 Tax=Heterodermia speciosa TaxID=116794 RepID=A0A8H3IUW4_9LECA|nr:MAG: hypothetical protein HETSPECPRED_007252 [Heterodermia speciosa]